MNAAEKMYQRALNGYEKTLGRNHASTLNAVNNLGNVYFEQDKLKEAEGMYRHVESSGKPNLEALQAVGNLGVILERQGKLDEAKEIYLQELKGIEELLGKDHQEARMVKEKLRILKRKKRWKRLKSLFRLKWLPNVIDDI
jgi:tetratricopeptide (TPR) repeat protein